MSIFNGLGGDDLAEAWSGSNEVVEVWAGGNKVWEKITDPVLGMGPEVYLTFENSISENRGTQNLTGPTKTNGGGQIVAGTAEYRGLSGDRFSNYRSSWVNGGTLMCWARTVSVRTSGTLDIIQRNSLSGTMNELYIVEDSAANRYYAGCTTGGQWFDVASPDLGGEKDRQWHHLAISVTALSGGTAAYLSLYVDGAFVASSGVRNVPVVNFDAATELYLAQSRLYNTWTGNLDNVATFNRPLLDNEIKAIYDAQKPTMPFIPTIATLHLSEMKQGVPFSQQLAANFSATSWSATGVPAGLTLNASTGLLSGTPSTISSGTMAVTANGANGQTATMDFPWSVISRLRSINVPFNSNADIDNFFPIRGFDARTASNSPRNPAFTFNGMLVAGDNSVNTYWQALHDGEIVSELTDWVLTTGDVMNTVARPTEIILSSDANFQNQLLLQIGSGNLNLVSRTTGAVTSLRTLSRTIGTNSNIRVTRNGLNYTVYHNGTSVYTWSGTSANAAAWFRTPGRAYSGVTMYSTSGQWSSRVAHFSIDER